MLDTGCWNRKKNGIGKPCKKQHPLAGFSSFSFGATVGHKFLSIKVIPTIRKSPYMAGINFAANHKN